MVRIVTVYTDASHCHRLGVAGWACWVKADGLQGYTRSGVLRGVKAQASIAELAAVANGLAAAEKAVGIRPDDLIVIVTDCQRVIHVLERKPGLILHRDEREIRDWIEGRLAALGAARKVNKVKAHSRHDGVRSGVNGLVDGLAKAALRQARKRVTPPAPTFSEGSA